ncbi:MAG TPA: AAA family ATPase [Streptosporangiaceae bacterium]|nr:AAA family ATPase [Streptosporangiaceae bacterium]
MESMLCPVLIGRSGELAELTGALERAAQGHGGAVCITGDGGIGKSRLARDVATRAVERGFQVLAGRGTQSAAPVPYRPVSEALLGAARAGLTPDSPGLSEYRAALGMLVPEWSRPGDAAGRVSPVVIGEALLRMLTSAGASGGLLILEDLHWADPETLAVIEYLVDNLAEANVLCLFTLREAGPSEAVSLLQSATARRVVIRIDLPRLTPADIRQMAAACLDVNDVREPVFGLLADCDGLPFAVEEILAAAVSAGKLARSESGWQVHDEVSTRVPDSIAGSVRSRLAALGAEVSTVVVSAAVLGKQFDWTLLPAVAGVPQSQALDALQRACDVQLIEPTSADAVTFRFRHSLTRDAILGDLLPPDLASRSAAAAEAIEQAHPGLPDAWCELAAELRAAAGQLPEAAELLLTAGRRAVLQGALSSAEATLRDAQELLSEPADEASSLRMEVDEALTEALSMAGDIKQLEPLTEDLIARLEAAGADPRRQALIRLRAASTRPEDDPRAATEHVTAAASIAEQLQDVELGSRTDAVAARAALTVGNLDRADELAHRSLAAAEAAGLSGWATEVALESLEVIGRRERMRDPAAARDAFERYSRVAATSGIGIWQLRAQHELATMDMMADGSTCGLSLVRQHAHQAGAICVAAVAELQLANLRSLGADLDDALALARQCEHSAAQIKAVRIRAMSVCLQANIAAIRAAGEQSKLLAQRADDMLPDDPEILVTTWGQARVLAALFEDDLPQALRRSTTAMSYSASALAMTRQSQGVYSALQAPLLAPRRALALNALLRAVTEGDAAAAIRLARDSGAGSSWNAGCLGYAEAVLAGRDGHPRRATSLAAEASAQLAPFAPWWDNLGRRLVAPSALEDGWGSPVAWLREAAGEFDLTGHDRLAAACRRLLRRAGERVPRAGRGTAHVPPQMRRLGITSREMDVFKLVARGDSNADIAAKLYISRKTVETHIASLVAKTGWSGRRELAANAAAANDCLYQLSPV